MKFTKRYREFIKEQDKGLPIIQLKQLKVVLKNCELKHMLIASNHSNGQVCNCPVCDEAFFPSLLTDMIGVVKFFNKHAKKLLESHLASGFHKYVLLMKDKLQGISHHHNLINQGNDLVKYAIVNAVAMQKILKKYDKVHCSMKGQRFKQEAQTKQLELLKSPWLLELMAFWINLREIYYKKDDGKEIGTTSQISPVLFDCFLHDVDEARPSLLVTIFNSITINLDLMCPICLETVFDPISLTCSHLLCYMCACSVASITIVDGLKAADPKSKCPICRQAGVFGGAVHLEELSMLLSRSLPEYWKERSRRERRERIQQVKEHWEFQCRAFVGYE